MTSQLISVNYSKPALFEHPPNICITNQPIQFSLKKKGVNAPDMSQCPPKSITQVNKKCCESVREIVGVGCLDLMGHFETLITLILPSANSWTKSKIRGS